MTDFLEELLNGQVEEEEEEQALNQPFRRLIRPAHLSNDQPEDRGGDMGWEDAEWTDVETEGLSETTALKRQRFTTKQRASEALSHHLQVNPAPVLVSDWKVSTPGTEVTKTPIQSVWEMIRRTYSAARLWQVRTVRPSGSSSEPGGLGNGQAYGLQKQENVIRANAAQVDAVFARDARRYDGPLRIL